MEKVKNKYSFAIKIICYTLIPILLVSIITSIISVVYCIGDNIDTSIKDYFQTQQFADTYKASINDNTHISMNYDEQRQYYLYEELEIDAGQGIKKLYYNRMANSKNFKYLVIDKTKNIAFTNLDLTMKTDSIAEIKEEISKNEYYWNYSNNNIETNIEKANLENIKYSYVYERIENDYNCEIYTSIGEKLRYIDQYYTENIIYTIFISQYEGAYINIPVCIILLIVSIILVTMHAGRKKNFEGVYLNGFDKLPLGIAIIIGAMITIIPIMMAITMADVTFIIIFIPVAYIGIIICYDTFVKRLKSHTLFKNTLIYIMLKGIFKIGKNISKNVDVSIKLTIALATFIFLNFISVYSIDRYGFLFAAVQLLVIWILTYVWIYKKIISFIQINNLAKQVYEGNTNIDIKPENYTGLLRQLCIYIKDISGGFSNAIEQGIKSERMKTELITNVSHDIKTPLTSIINYVDLLKKEEMPNEKAKEYLEILDKKSQRLKKLTEDLVEASKASSGNIKMNMERINVKELINQISGEYEDKFKERNLELIISVPEKEIYIQADGRYLYRVLENVYSNIVKYALENSRVYADVVAEKENVEIRLKNISKEKLNISADELMQRFVRGDSSRNTEGSGLGLSIAQSLTTLQNGEFSIYLDGDLFKVVIKFKMNN